MTNFEKVQKLMQTAEKMENDLKRMRDTTDILTKQAINESLRTLIILNQNLWTLDKCLDDDKQGAEDF